MRIIEDIKRALTAPGSEHLVIEDRGAAIRTAVEIARASDVILVAGKGHETYQIRGTIAYPFDEREIVRNLAAESPTRLPIA